MDPSLPSEYPQYPVHPLRLAALLPVAFVFLTAPIAWIRPEPFPVGQRVLEFTLLAAPPVAFAWTLFLVEAARRCRPEHRFLPAEVLSRGLASTVLLILPMVILADGWGTEEPLMLATASAPGWLISLGLLLTALPHLPSLQSVRCVTGGYALLSLLGHLAISPLDSSRNTERGLLFQSVLLAFAVLVRLAVWWAHQDDARSARRS